MEMCEEHKHEHSYSIELYLIVLDDIIFIHTSMLVMLCIVCKGSKDLSCGEKPAEYSGEAQVFI